jgi:hypothetical protein
MRLARLFESRAGIARIFLTPIKKSASRKSARKRLETAKSESGKRRFLPRTEKTEAGNNNRESVINRLFSLL